MYFQDNIKYLRKVSRLSQKELADLLHKATSTISCWESGARTPTVNDTNKIAAHFNIPLNDLLFTNLALNPDVLTYSKDEDDLLVAFKQLSAEARKTVIAVAKGLVK